MEQLIQLGGLSYDDEICFNHCRLAYRAMTILDVITGDGTKVTRHALDLSCLSRASSKWDWPNECPCNKDILRWHTGLKRLTSENLSLPFSLRLEHWIQPSHLNWQWFYQRCNRILYHTINNACHVFCPFSPRSTVAFRRAEVLSSSLMPHHVLERATVCYEHGRILFEGGAANAYPAEQVYDSIYDLIQQWEDSWPLADSFSWRIPL
jgi:hypothetical protein